MTRNLNYHVCTGQVKRGVSNFADKDRVDQVGFLKGFEDVHAFVVGTFAINVRSRHHHSQFLLSVDFV